VPDSTNTNKLREIAERTAQEAEVEPTIDELAEEVVGGTDHEQNKFPTSNPKIGVLNLKKVPVERIQQAASVVKLPKPPTYTTRTISGRIQTHTMDEQAAMETPGGKELWVKYQNELGESQNDSFNILAKVAITLGVEYIPPDDGWEEEFKFYGIPLPDNIEQRKTLYLMNNVELMELVNLVTQIVEYSSTNEALVKKK